MQREGDKEKKKEQTNKQTNESHTTIHALTVCAWKRASEKEEKKKNECQWKTQKSDQ